MTSNKNFDLITSSSEKEFNEFKIRLENFHQSYEKFLNELQLTPNELKEGLEKIQFDPEVVEQFQELEKQFDDNLKSQFDQKFDPLKTKATFKQQSAVQQHWLFIR
ncbi:MAG: hypothetical protein Q8K60_04590 [Parachlamydiaceae bacterium]|nr:hypothetical protein [Parachlamydiaceae bacterium]